MTRSKDTDKSDKADSGNGIATGVNDQPFTAVWLRLQMAYAGNGLPIPTLPKGLPQTQADLDPAMMPVLLDCRRATGVSIDWLLFGDPLSGVGQINITQLIASQVSQGFAIAYDQGLIGTVDPRAVGAMTLWTINQLNGLDLEQLIALTKNNKGTASCTNSSSHL